MFANLHVKNWLTYLKRGLERKQPEERIATPGRPASAGSDFANLRPFWERHWRKGAGGGLLILISSLFGLPQPLITRFIVDQVILDRRIGLLAAAVIAFAAVSIIERLSRLLYQFHFARFEQEVILDIQQDLFSRTLRLPKAFFDANETGYLMSRLSSDVHDLRYFFSETVIHVVSNSLRFVGGLAFLFYLEWMLALGVLVVLPGMMACVLYFSSRIRYLSHRSMEQQANISSCFQESLSAASLIKAFSTEDVTVKRLIDRLRAAFHISLERLTVSSVANLAVQSMPGLARLVVLGWGAYLVVQERWTLGSLLAFQAYLAYVFGPAQFLASANMEVQTALAALQRVSALFDIAPEESMGTGFPAVRLEGKIELRDVSFAYGSGPPVLDDISFRVAPGERVAIVGPSGVGKTTLLSLILCFYRPTAGEILFDGRPAREYELNSLRRRIGYVSQTTQLLSGTVLENLRYGNADAEAGLVIQAARAASIHEFVMGLPDGYESRLGEGGLNLSEGQRQRISLARALVKDPDILILDEPTAALDSMTEKSIMEILPDVARGKTLFVVAHRLSTISGSDRILLLNENRLVAVGPHDTLLKTNPYYRSLIAEQGLAGPG